LVPPRALLAALVLLLLMLLLLLPGAWQLPLPSRPAAAAASRA
jgi:hypothetical protein